LSPQKVEKPKKEHKEKDQKKRGRPPKTEVAQKDTLRIPSPVHTSFTPCAARWATSDVVNVFLDTFSLPAEHSYGILFFKKLKIR
jgi:hypothetical protein